MLAPPPSSRAGKVAARRDALSWALDADLIDARRARAVDVTTLRAQRILALQKAVKTTAEIVVATNLDGGSVFEVVTGLRDPVTATPNHSRPTPPPDPDLDAMLLPERHALDAVDALLREAGVDLEAEGGQ